MDSCVLYIDESGDPGWPKPEGSSNTKWYTMSGVVFTPGQDLRAKETTNKILCKYISEEIRGKYPDKRYELHYTDLANGNNIYHKLKREQRKEMADKVFDFILDLKATIVSASVNKLDLKKQRDCGVCDPKYITMHTVLSKFSAYLNKRNMVGYVIFDEESYQHDKKIKNQIHEIRKRGVGIPGILRQPPYNSKLENVLNTIQFCPSELSPGIQYADFVAKSVWNHREWGKSDRYSQIDPLWDRDGETVHRDTAFPCMLGDGGKEGWPCHPNETTYSVSR